MLLENLCKRVFRIIELLVVILICSLIIYGILSFIFSSNDPSDTRIGKIIEFLNQNWKVLLLITIPLFYYPIRTFIEEIEEFRGAKRQKKPVNPPTPTPEKKEE